jgi:hypothetical protein
MESHHVITDWELLKVWHPRPKPLLGWLATVTPPPPPPRPPLPPVSRPTAPARRGDFVLYMYKNS